LNDPRTAAFVELAQRYSLRSCWSEPIRSGEGAPLGTFAIYCGKPGTPNDMHVRFIESSARLAGIALDRSRAERALRASEYRYQALAELAPVGIYRADADGQTVYINPRGLELLRQTMEEARGAGWVNALHPDDAERVRLHWRERVGSPHPSLAEFRILSADEEPTWVIAQSRPEFDDAGHIVAYVGTFTDISQRKQEEQELAHARDVAQAASLSKDRFLAMLSHELRTPLTPVLATITLIEARHDLPDDLRAQVMMIRRNVEIEARLIDDLLDLTRISHGKVELRLEAVDAHAALQSALGICRGDADAKGLTIDLDLSAEHYHVHADAARLQQVFWNLINNAIKFTPRSGRITLRSQNEAPDSMTVRVIDTGIGIAPEMLPRLFSAFEQGERTITRRFGGLGLGLSISRALVDMQGGQLIADSRGANQGTTFTLTLPTI
jgi:PAS domain S-box-containing protein